jgi:hypothetical protein
MGAIRRFADGDMAIVEGRALTPEDSVSGERVCVISREVAREYGLEIGDIFPLKPGTKLFEQYFHLGARAITRERYGAPEKDMALEIVGIYTDIDSYKKQVQAPNWSYSINTVFVPKTLLPIDEATLSEHMFAPGEVSFTVDNAWDIEAFTEETAPLLEALGLTLFFNDAGWPEIAHSFQSSNLLSVINIVVFSIALAAAIWLTVYLFIVRKKREYAIMRALGTTKSVAARTLLLPLMVLALAAVSAGSGAAWLYTARTVARGNALSMLREFSVNTAIPTGVVLVCVSVPLLLTPLIALVLLWRISAQSPLALLQNNVKKRRRPGKTQKSEPFASLRPESVSGTPKTKNPRSYGTSAAVAYLTEQAVHGSAFRFISRYVLRHISRTAVKSSLIILLAALLLGAMGQFALMKRSYSDLVSDTVITANFVGGLPVSIAHAINNNSMVTTPYYEAEASVGLNLRSTNLVATNDIARFTGEEPELNFIDGYDLSCFNTAGDVVVLGKSLLEKYDLGLGDTVELLDDRAFEQFLIEQRRYIFRHSGGSGSAEETPETDFHRIVEKLRLIPHIYTIVGAIELPSGEYKDTVFTPGAYSASWECDVLEVTLADNKRSDEFRAWSENVVSSTGKLQFVMDTSKLESPKNTLRLLEALYPGALAALLLIGGFLCCLMTFQGSKEAAIMRVLGTTKEMTRAILASEQVLLSIAGLALGVSGLLFYKGQETEAISGQLLVFVSLFFAVISLCAAVCSVLATRRSVLELLQTKE